MSIVRSKIRLIKQKQNEKTKKKEEKDEKDIAEYEEYLNKLSFSYNSYENDTINSTDSLQSRVILFDLNSKKRNMIFKNCLRHPLIMKDKIDDEEYKSSLVNLIRIDIIRNDYIKKLNYMNMNENPYQNEISKNCFSSKRKILFNLTSEQEENIKNRKS